MRVHPASTLIAIAAIAVAVSVLAYGFLSSSSAVAPAKTALELENSEQFQQQVQNFCGGCHALPQPDVLPRASWAEEIPKAYARYRKSGRHDLNAPVQAEVIAYYSRSAPAELIIPDAPASTPSALQFRLEQVKLPPGMEGVAVSYLCSEPSATSEGGAATKLLLCDMFNGSVQQFGWEHGQRTLTLLARQQNPDHIVRCDFDQDGRPDYLVSNLGVLQPSDDLRGSVVWLNSRQSSGKFAAVTLQQGLGRVADAQPADFDGDGDQDVVVAEFGFEQVGRVLWLETVSLEEGRVETMLHEIDPRHGSIHVPVTDLDGDGDPDVVALISQEHEVVVAYMNDGHGNFLPRTLFQADNPSFGSSGLELVDLDGDGDQDLVFTNGDTLDTFQLRPSHGVHWLENQGNGDFVHQRLATMPGAVRAVSADLDQDGDLDLAAVAFCPPALKEMTRPKILDTLLWLEQVSPGRYVRHALESQGTGYMALAAGDYDDDGDQDLAVGEFSPFTPQSRQWLRLYWNQLSTEAKTSLR